MWPIHSGLEHSAMLNSFGISRLPRIEFGSGKFHHLAELASRCGRRVLIVTGACSFTRSSHWDHLRNALSHKNTDWALVHVEGEPSPDLVDEMVRAHRQGGYSVVLGIGGGSALDAGKAVAGLLIPGNSVRDHLEGVGPELPYNGPSVPFIAVPTTAGTGSEATKNAVLSVPGPDGFKKSFRDERLVAEYAVVDPDLLATCPPGILAANGMDAFTQLLESYVSIKSNPFTDALAISGLEAVRDGLLPWYEGAAEAADSRTRMAYAALVSGITLAQVGLGSVHGLASPLGAYFPIPHGVVCGTLVAAATRVNMQALQERDPTHPALGKYARVGRLLARREMSDLEARAFLVETLDDWTRRLALARLGTYGIRQEDLPHLVANSRGSSMKTNPIVLTDEELTQVLMSRL